MRFDASSIDDASSALDGLSSTALLSDASIAGYLVMSVSQSAPGVLSMNEANDMPKLPSLKLKVQNK
jgi:hypothetical protein